MKKVIITLAIALTAVTQSFAMSHNEIRENARFLSDRMAYELGLTPQQYEDCYEINYDFLTSIDPVMDGVVYGHEVAIENYYDYLDYRNEDLRYVLNSMQYAAFMDLDYFFRPIYTSAGRWFFRVHQVYHDLTHYYYDVPSIYHHYHGAHARIHHPHGYYVGAHRYHHEFYAHPRPIRGMAHHNDHHRRDFGHDYHHNSNANHRGSAPGHHDSGNHHSTPDRHHSTPDRHHNDHGSMNHGGNNSHNSRPGGNSHGGNDHGSRPSTNNHNSGNHGGSATRSSSHGGSGSSARGASPRGSREGGHGGGGHRR